MAVFARTTRPDHLLLAMAARDLLAVADTALPLLVLERAAAPTPSSSRRRQQAGLLAEARRGEAVFLPTAAHRRAGAAPRARAPGRAARGPRRLRPRRRRAPRFGLDPAPAPARPRGTRSRPRGPGRQRRGGARRGAVVGAELSTFAADGPARRARSATRATGASSRAAPSPR